MTSFLYISANARGWKRKIPSDLLSMTARMKRLSLKNENWTASMLGKMIIEKFWPRLTHETKKDRKMQLFLWGSENLNETFDICTLHNVLKWPKSRIQEKIRKENDKKIFKWNFFYVVGKYFLFDFFEPLKPKMMLSNDRSSMNFIVRSKSSDFSNSRNFPNRREDRFWPPKTAKPFDGFSWYFPTFFSMGILYVLSLKK